MISSSGEQNDKEVLETSFARLMQMYMFVIEVLQKSKYHYPHLPWHTSVFSLRVYNCSVVGEGKCGIDNWQGGPLAKASQRWLQLVMFTNQNQFNILIYKLIHIFYAYFIHIEGNTVPAPGGSLPSTNNVLCPHKTDFQMPSWRKWREVWIILRLGKQIKHSIIFCFNVSYCFLFLIHTLLHYIPL